MKRHLKSIAGVTLLEVMLVLAIAAMIIVMSVKYYQSAVASNQANGALSSIQAVTAAADGIAQGDGTYASVTTAAVSGIAGSQALQLQWNQSISIVGTAASYTVTLPATPSAVCNSLIYKLKANAHYTAVSACAAAGSSSAMTYSYIP